LAVAVLHANVGQRPGWDNYAPCAIADLQAAGMDYWALGHVHVPGPICDRPPIVYSGSTQGLDPTEEGPRGCYVVELDPSGAQLEFVETAAVLWRRLAVDLSGAATLDEAHRMVGEACATARRDGGGRPVLARVELEGRSQVHADLARPGVLADLTADLRRQELDEEPWLWIDRVRDATAAAIDLEALEAEEGLRGDLVRLAAAWASDEDAARELVEEILAPVRAQLAVRPELGVAAERLIERARDLCLDRLGGDAG
jgi:DNA repair exonuclease SbcCD nuclease subunit